MVKIKGGVNKTFFLGFKKYFLVFSILISLVFSSFLFIQTASAHTLAENSSAQEIKIDVPDTGPTDLQTIFDNIWNILFGAAAIVAVIFIIWGGYQYMTSGGGEGAEKAKKTIIGAIIGLIIIISAVAIVNFVIAIMHGELQGFSAKLYDNNSSTTGTSGTNNNSGTNSPTNPVATPSVTNTSQITPKDAADQIKINGCKTYENSLISCYKNVSNFIYNTKYCTQGNPNDTGLKACNALTSFLTQYQEDMGTSNQKINGKEIQNVTNAFYNCYTSEGGAMSFTCNADQLENTVKNNMTATITPTAPGSGNSGSSNNTQQLTPYQSCVKDAQVKYNSCRNQLGQACYSQQSAYKACLTDAIYYIFRLFNSKYCDKVKQTYNKCQSDWQTNCSNALSRAQETCRLNYPTIY